MSRILIVEDDEDLRGMVATMLEAEGHDAVECPDGESAMREVAEERPDLMLLDLLMPSMSGFDVLNRIGPRAVRGFPVVILSAILSLGDAGYALRAGADDYLVKPFKLDELLAKVRAHLAARS